MFETPVFTSSESSGGEFDVDDEEFDYQPEISEELKSKFSKILFCLKSVQYSENITFIAEPMWNQTEFITAFFRVAESTLPRMSSIQRQIEVRNLCNTLKVGRRLRRRFNVIRIRV